jgi:hypothetical protein
LKDAVASLRQDLGRIIHAEAHKREDPGQLQFAPEAAVKFAVAFAKTHLRPYMTNRVISQPDLNYWTEDAMDSAWNQMYRRVLRIDVDKDVGLFVEEVLEQFMRLGEELDLD